MAVRQTRNQSGGAKLTQNARASFLVIAPAAILAIGILALLGVAGGFLLHSRLDKLETELAFAKREVESTNERLVSLQREVSQIRQGQSSATAMIARLDNRLSATTQPTSPQNNALQITAVEAKSIREFLMKIDAFKPMVEAGHKVGDTIPEDRLLDFSAVLTQEVPKLKNTNYTIDQNGSIIIVSENRIVAILDFLNVAR
jgi:septal ring factor EnvC (AmiA/AmiB activator)